MKAEKCSVCRKRKPKKGYALCPQCIKLNQKAAQELLDETRKQR